LFGIYLHQNARRYQQLLDLSINSILSLFGLSLTIPLANGSINYLIFKNLEIPITFKESFGLAAVNTLANQLPLSGGLIAKGLYLKERYRLAYGDYLSSMIAAYVCFITANGSLGLIVISLLALVNEGATSTKLILGFAAMSASVVLFIVPINFHFIPIKWRIRISKISEGWQVLSRNRILLLILTIIQVANTLLTAARFWIAFHMLSQNVSYLECLLFSSATILTRLVSIMPGGLGVREGIVAGIASVLGFDVGVSALAVGIDRLVGMLGIVVLGTYYSYILGKRLIIERDTENDRRDKLDVDKLAEP
jgi:uncharacterized membrane protein YbhN (UPF0104 family)